MAALGFMQGRLSAPVGGRIQAFPWEHWQEEFAGAAALGLRLIEWTIDEERLYENPVMTPAGRARMRELGAVHGVAVQSLTGDCFMQAPFHKADGGVRVTLLANLDAIVDACAAAGIRRIVFPLVDNGSLETGRQEACLRENMLARATALSERGIRIVFESDFEPARLARFIAGFPVEAFGINYDIGNSAALGFDAVDEVGAYGERIEHVHVKDRMRGGTTVPLGEGDADFPAVFGALRRTGYAGDFILQTARAQDGDHAGALARYRDLTLRWWEESGSRT